MTKAPLEKLAEIHQLLEKRRKYHKLEYYKPYDWQLRFHNAIGHGTEKPASQKVALAGNGTGKCLCFQSLIQHPDGTVSKVGDLYNKRIPFEVLAWNGKNLVPRTVTNFIKKPPEECFRIHLSNGKWFECAANHRVLTPHGYAFVGELLKSFDIPRRSNWGFSLSVRAVSALRCLGKLIDFLGGCLPNLHLHGGQLLEEAGTFRALSPLLNDALRRNFSSFYSGDPERTRTSKAQLSYAHPSSIGALPHCETQPAAFLSSTSNKFSRLAKCCIQEFQQLSIAASSRLLSIFELLNPQKYACAALLSPFNDGNSIVSYKPIGIHDIYDFTVPVEENYLCAGVIHHNTVCGGFDTAIHLTGMYPDWWKGHRFYKPIRAMIGGNTNEAVRDISQKTLFGDPNEPNALGSGTIPVNLIGKRSSKPGVPNAFDTVLVKHASGGWSKVMFRAYEQGAKKHMGHRIELGWLDEEPPQDIWSQYLRATISTNGILSITFTPESGLTEVVNGFMNNIQKGQALIQASWDDSPHLVKDGELTDEAKQLESGFMPHEREMRRRGVPSFGTGLIFPFSQEALECDPFEIPRHWPQIIGIDFGFGHPFGATKLAWDRDSDTVYVVAEYREARAIPAIHAAAIKPWGDWPVSWPHDGLNTEKGTGDELIQSYREEGLSTLPNNATNPPDFAQGQKEGDGGNSVEAALMHMYERMETGRFKVFKTCRIWFEEQRTYHRDEKGKIIKLRDDVLSASRYAHMMLRHARTAVVRVRRSYIQEGARNWA